MKHSSSAVTNCYEDLNFERSMPKYTERQTDRNPRLPRAWNQPDSTNAVTICHEDLNLKDQCPNTQTDRHPSSARARIGRGALLL